MPGFFNVASGGPVIRSHITCTILTKAVISERGWAKGQPLPEHYRPQLMKGKALRLTKCRSAIIVDSTEA